MHLGVSVVKSERKMNLSFTLHLPHDFDDYEHEVEAKGYFSEAILEVNEQKYKLTFYDLVRLEQDVSETLRTTPVFTEKNLLIVPSVTRKDMLNASEYLVQTATIKNLRCE
jgi:hypothetical protein